MTLYPLAIPRPHLYSYKTDIDDGKVKMQTATLSSKFQISIPKAIREEQQWREGQELVFISKGKGVLLVPVPALNELAGLARGADTGNYRDRQDRV